MKGIQMTPEQDAILKMIDFKVKSRSDYRKTQKNRPDLPSSNQVEKVFGGFAKFKEMQAQQACLANISVEIIEPQEYAQTYEDEETDDLLVQSKEETLDLSRQEEWKAQVKAFRKSLFVDKQDFNWRRRDMLRKLGIGRDVISDKETDSDASKAV